MKRRLILVFTLIMIFVASINIVEAVDYYAVIVGVQEYDNIKEPIYKAFDNASKMKEKLLQGQNWAEANIILLNTKESTTKSSILNAIDWMKNKAKNDDVCLLYINSHGATWKNAITFQKFWCLAPSDAIPDDPLVPWTDLSFDGGENHIDAIELGDYLALINNLIVILDCCYSGGMLRTLGIPNWNILTACKEDEPMFHGSINGAYFVKNVIEAITQGSGADINGDGAIDLREIFDYASPRTIVDTSNIEVDGHHGPQYPQCAPNPLQRVKLVIFPDTKPARPLKEVKGNQTGTFRLSESPFLVTGDITVPDGQTLTIEPGVEVRFNGNYGIFVTGQLKAIGTASNRISFNSNRTTPSPGDWQGIFLGSNRGYDADLGTSLAYCDISYAGSSNGSVEIYYSRQNVTVNNCNIQESAKDGIFIGNSSPSISNCTISRNAGRGIQADSNSEPTIDNCTISNNGSYGITLYADSVKQLASVTLTKNYHNAIQVLSENISTGSWKDHGVPYIISGDLYVGDGNVWTLEPGCQLKFEKEHYVSVLGTLKANGKADKHIIFTSFKDDGVGGDTNADGNITTPTPGDWQGVFLGSSRGYDADMGTILVYCDIHYAGTSNGNLEIHCSAKNVAITDCTSQESAKAGIYINNSAPLLKRCTISRNEANGIQLSSSDPSIADSTISNNSKAGIQSDDSNSEPIISNCTISKNRGYGIILYADSIGQLADITLTDNTPNAIKVLSESINTSTWKNHKIPYIISGDLTVNDKNTLTIESGCQLKFEEGRQLLVLGALKAIGTATNHISFTSFKDDQIGGDTNVDGSITTPTQGDWQGISLGSSRGYDADADTILDYCDIQYAGMEKGNVEIYYSGKNVTLSHCIIQESAKDGIYLTNSAPLLSDCTIYSNTGRGIQADSSADAIIKTCTISDNGSYGISLYADGVKLLTQVTLKGNHPNAIQVFSDTISTGTWHDHGVPYVISGDLSVSDGNTFAIDAGCQFKFEQNHYLSVLGALKANGTATKRIIFTSFKDDNIGGDTNGDGNITTPVPGDWQGVFLGSSRGYDADIGTVLVYCDIRYGGTSSGNLEIYYSGKNITISNCTIEYSAKHGIFVDNSAPSFSNCTISNNAGKGILLSSSSAPLLTDCIIDKNGDYGIALYSDSVKQLDSVTLTNNIPNAIQVLGGNISMGIWKNHGVPYIISSDLSVSDGNTLTLEAGCQLKFELNHYLSVLGILKVNGTATKRVTFTSYKDDLVGGDTNADGNVTTPSKGDWQGIFLGSSGGYSADAGTHLAYCDIRYAGTKDGNLEIHYSEKNVTITNCTIQYSAHNGIYINNSSPVLRNNLLTNNTDAGMKIDSGAPDFGTQLNAGRNAIYNNGGFEVENRGRDAISAINNYWGTTSPASIAASIFDKNDDANKGEVIFTPFLASSDLTPTAPELLAPADGAIVNTFTPLLSWLGVEGGPVYTVQIAQDNAFKNLLLQSEDASTSYTVPTGQLGNGSTYYWRVQAKNTLGTSNWSTPRAFTVRVAPGDSEPPITVSDYTVTYPAGLSLVSIPLQPDTAWTLADFVSHIGSDVVQFVIWLDKANGKFVPYLPNLGETAAAKHPISGGEGYILSLAESRSVTFRGIAWGAEMPASPKQLVAEGSHQTPLLVIGGIVYDEHGRFLDGIQLHIKNKTTGQEIVQISGNNASPGAYIAMLTDFTHNRAAKVGDIIEIRAVAADGQFRSTALQFQLTHENIRLGHLQIPKIQMLSRPQSTALLQNYPNPFNPETWIPYQLAQSEDVMIKIFNLQGRLVRTLRLGHQPAGYYLNKSRAAYWDGRNESGERVASGVYMYQQVTPSFQQTRRLVVLK